MNKTNPKSVKVNAVLNSIKTLMTILFPLVTMSYLSRVLGKEGYGKFNYSVSIVSYFILIAGLGISTYGIREGAKVRDNREQEEQLDSEIFSLNLLSTIIAYAILSVLLLASRKLVPYREYILIVSINIIFITLGTDWINSIYEDFLYLTLRYIFVQIASISLMLIFVRSSGDLLRYVWIYLFSQIGANVANIFYVKKYVRLHIVVSKKIFTHLMPTLILFGSSIAVTIYVNSDITVLGIIKGDAAVGVYSVASRIYAGAKQIAIAGTVVTIPRLARVKMDTDKIKLLYYWDRIKYRLCQRGIIKKVQTYRGNDLYDVMISQNQYFTNKRIIPGIFFEWDNTSRHKQRGYIISHVEKAKFMQYMSKIKNADFAIVNAWNEWCEDMILEPTEEDGYRNLEWIKEFNDSQS